MKLKKLIALAATATLAMSSMTAFASELEIGGDLDYVNTTIYNLTLPTSESLAFKLDPQGLTSLDAGKYDSSKAGLITSETPMTAINKSSVDVKLSATFYIVDSSDKVALKSSISDEKANEIALTVTADDTTNTVINVTEKTKDDATAKDFAMTKATYNFAKDANGDYTYELDDSTGSTLNLTIGGNIAKEADWSAYTGDDAATITLHAVFKFTNADGDAIDAEAADTTPVYSKANGAEITLDTTKNVVSAVAWGAAEDTTPNAVSDFDFDKDTKVLTLPSGLFGQATADSTRYIKVTYGDNSSVVIAVTIAE